MKLVNLRGVVEKQRREILLCEKIESLAMDSYRYPRWLQPLRALGDTPSPSAFNETVPKQHQLKPLRCTECKEKQDMDASLVEVQGQDIAYENPHSGGYDDDISHARLCGRCLLKALELLEES